MAFDLPRGVITPVQHVDVRLDSTPHPFELRNRDAIAANWEREHAANPALFNGRMVLLSELALRGTTLTGRCHPVNYATMLYFRKNKGDADIEHSFAFPALVSSDNKLVAIRMAQHTANPGRVYFAAGSFEPADFVDSRCDVPANMMREVMEETGLDISKAATDSRFHIYSIDSSTVIFRRYWLNRDAHSIARSIESFVATEQEPEIEGPVVIDGIGEKPAGMAAHMEAIIDWHFAQRR